MVYNLDSRPLNQWPVDLLRKKAAAMAEAAGVDLQETWDEEFREITGKRLNDPQLRRDDLVKFIEEILVDVYDCSLDVKIAEELPPPEPPKPEDPAEIRKERDSLRQELQEVKQQLGSLTGEKTQLETRVQQLEQEKSTAAEADAEKLKSLTAEKAQLEARVQQLEQQKSTVAPLGIGSQDVLLNENTRLKDRVQQLEQAQAAATRAASERLRALASEKTQLETKLQQLQNKLQQPASNAAKNPLAGSLWDTPSPAAKQAPKPHPVQKTGPMISDIFKTPSSNN